MNKTSTQKILAGVLSIAMVLTLVVGVAVSSANADTYSYTRSLTVGSTGADVTALQSMLNAGGYLSVAPTGYFGSLTKAALAAWQSSVGISPASGYFGPITRAYLATNGSSVGTTTGTPGCSAGAMFNSMTGAPCGTTSTPGCPAGAMFNSMTGAPCSTVTTTLPAGCTSTTGYSSTTGQSCASGTVTTSGTGEGTLTVTQSAMAVSNANIQTNTDVPVYGLQLKAQLGDVTVQRIDLDVADTINTSPASTENPGNFINNVKVKDDAGNILMNRNVSISDFITGTSSTDYYIRLSGFNFVVPNGQTKNLIVTFSTNAGIDTSRTLTIMGYGTNSLLSTSGNNVTNYDDISTKSTSQTFQKPGVSTLSVGTDATNPNSAVNYVDSTLGAQKVTTLAFNALSSSGDSTVTEIDATVNTNGMTTPSAVYLYDGSNLLAARALTSGSANQTVAFTSLTDLVSSGTTHVFTLKVDEPSNATAGSAASTTLTRVYYQESNGSTNSVTPSIVGNNQSFYKSAPNLTFISGSASSSGTNQSGQTTAISGTFTLKVHPQPGQMVQPQASDFTVYVGTANGSGGIFVPVASTTVSFQPTPSSNTAPLPANSDSTITLTAIVNALASLPGTGNYQFYLTRASTTVNDITGTPVSQTMATSTLSNFYTSSVSVSH